MTNHAFKRKNLMTVFPLLFFSLLFRSAYSAEPTEYRWYHTNLAGYFPSPNAVCETYVATRDPRSRTTLVRVRRSSDITFVCDLQYYSGQTYQHFPSTTPAHRQGGRCPYGGVYNSISGLCQPAVGKSDFNTCAAKLEGNELNVVSGNNYQEEQDFSYGSASGVRFARVYNSGGSGWRHNYAVNLRFSDNAVSLARADGSESFFNIGQSSVTGSVTELGRMAKLDDTWSYSAFNNDQYIFDGMGRLITFQPFIGGKQKITYQGDKVTVTDDLGFSLTITEGAEHRPLKLEAPNEVVSYQYDGLQRLVKVSRNGRGTSEERLFHYESFDNSSLLTGITDQRGVRIATWTYDARGRVIASEGANGSEPMEVTYDDAGFSTVKNALGKSTIYRFVTVGTSNGITRVSRVEGEPSANCPASNSSYTYNNQGQVLSKIDAKGFITQYTYNALGQEITRVEAAGKPQSRTFKTTWHPTFNLPLTVTEGSLVTKYTYDAQGRQTSRTQIAP